ncbi:unnamed protein product [Dovyalis caffra]|uniref:SHSP domain-containing protein n=1 Tax=Dovyalis caffra TaxID=77055 RepID=A0AAV1SNQ1_9ROSI|nr:unnamed protein product [Dovyalis caffra]
MLGLKSGDIKVQVENDNVLVIGGRRKCGKEKEETMRVRKEMRWGLVVIVEKLPPLEPKKPKSIEVKIA